MIGLSQMATLPNLEQQIPSQIYAHRKKKSELPVPNTTENLM